MEIHHHNLCPFSRMIRIILMEIKIDFEVYEEKFWQWNKNFLLLNPAGSLPIIINDKLIIRGFYSSLEYLNDLFFQEGNIFLLGKTIEEKTNNRFLCDWFSFKMYHEVTKYIIQEKAIKIILQNNSINSFSIRAAKKNLLTHIDYINHLLIQNPYLAGDKIGLIDYIAASHLSLLDYFNDVPWDKSSLVKSWYSIMKSRPTLQKILSEENSFISPPSHYKNPDF